MTGNLTDSGYFRSCVREIDRFDLAQPLPTQHGVALVLVTLGGDYLDEKEHGHFRPLRAAQYGDAVVRQCRSGNALWVTCWLSIRVTR